MALKKKNTLRPVQIGDAPPDEAMVRPGMDPASPSFRISDYPFSWLFQTTKRYTHRMDQVLKRVGMDVPGWRVLTILTEVGAASISALAEQGVSQLSTMTRVVQRLEREGLVSTRQSAEDARVTEAVLTEAGAQAVTVVRESAGRVFRRAFAGFADSDVELLRGLLMRLQRNLDAP